MTIGEKIKSLREQHNMTQTDIARRIGVATQTIFKYEKSIVTNIPLDTIENIANLFDVTPAYLMGWEDEPDTTLNSQVRTTAIRVPVLGKVVAGIPVEAVEEILDYEEITPELASCGEYFALKIKGSSMEPKISEGDVVIVRKQEDADNGDTAIILVNGDEATVKKIRKTPDGISLIPNNPSYDIAFFSNKEIESLPVRIIGKVVELRAKF